VRPGRRSLLVAIAGFGLLGPLPGGSAAAADGTALRRPPSGTIVVSAASSLTDAFTSLGGEFRRADRAVRVSFNFNASSTLAAQIEQGAPADVFASADQTTMDRLVRARLIRGRPTLFAQNRLAIAVAPGNPKRIRVLADTLRSGVTLVLCAPSVPCGTFARQAYERRGLHVGNVATGLNVRDTLSKVTLGEADAAVVYVTDVQAARGAVTGVPIPPAQNVRARYPIGVVAGSPHVAAATAFVQYTRSAAGQATLRRFGFLAP
jgi:molybdate transport system substrate-binding protein